MADYNQEKVYQLKPDSGEIRAIPMRPCGPVTLTFDQSINGFYVTCVENVGGRYQFRIRKKTFDGRINNVIYSTHQGKEHCHSVLVFLSLMVNEISSPLKRYYRFTLNGHILVFQRNFTLMSH